MIDATQFYNEPVSIDPAVFFENVTVKLGGVSILDRVTASVPRGGCTSIVGPNGAGKTTLLLALLGEVPYKGEIHFSPKINKKLRIGYVPQKLTFDRGIPLTVNEFMNLGFQKKPLWLGLDKELKKNTTKHLAMVKGEHLGDRNIGALSGGELQRVLLALALAQEPDLLVLDEPAAGVDVHGEHVFCDLLDNLRAKLGFTQLMVSHDLATVTHHATHVICLNHKVAAEGRPCVALTDETLTAIFGMHMGLVDSRSMPFGKSYCSAACCKGERIA
jgi:zinc transport system ATP-binding protein